MKTLLQKEIILEIFENFENPRNFFLKSAIFFYSVYKEYMFTIEIEDGREAPLMPSFKERTLALKSTTLIPLLFTHPVNILIIRV